MALPQVHHDIWDFDAPSPTVLFDQTYNGVTRKGIYESSKTGWVYFLDRATGQPLIGIDEKPVPQEPRNATAATQPYPVGDPFMDQCPEPLPNVPLMGCIFTPFWDQPVLLRPTGNGGTEWSPTTYSQQTGYVYTMAQQTDSTLAMRYLPYQYGKTYSLGASVPALGASIKSTFTAMDSRPTRSLAAGPTTASSRTVRWAAGGLCLHGRLMATWWRWMPRRQRAMAVPDRGLGISAPPMTWSDGKDQYVTVAVGGNRGGATTLDGDQSGPSP
jgi:hypothetical protein